MDVRLLEVEVGKLLRQRGFQLAVAESCTGGLVGHRITNIPGSSDYYLGSVTAYAYEAKERLLGVNHDTLLANGAVSQETALEMARGIRRVLAADVGASVTGIAGPGGGLPNKRVGLTWVGLSTPDGDWAFRFQWSGDRLQNKASSAEAVLRVVVDYLSGKLKPPPAASQLVDLVEVDASWERDGRISPGKFTWRGNTYGVESTGRRWQEGETTHILCMAAGGQVFELVYNPATQIWRMGFRPRPPAVA